MFGSRVRADRARRRCVSACAGRGSVRTCVHCRRSCSLVLCSTECDRSTGSNMCSLQWVCAYRTTAVGGCSKDHPGINWWGYAARPHQLIARVAAAFYPTFRQEVP